MVKRQDGQYDQGHKGYKRKQGMKMEGSRAKTAVVRQQHQNYQFNQTEGEEHELSGIYPVSRNVFNKQQQLFKSHGHSKRAGIKRSDLEGRKLHELDLTNVQVAEGGGYRPHMKYKRIQKVEPGSQGTTHREHNRSAVIRQQKLMSRVGSTAGGGPISDSDGIEDEEQDERHPGRRDTDTGRGGSSQFMLGKGKEDLNQNQEKQKWLRSHGRNRANILQIQLNSQNQFR